MARRGDVEAALADMDELLLDSDPSTSKFELSSYFHNDEASKQRLSRYTSCLLIIAIVFAIGFPLGDLIVSHSRSHLPHVHQSNACYSPIKRLEWRSLPEHRRHGYVTAVQRLTAKPSRLGLNTSLYDDFTYVHIKLKFQIHHVAINLPWHRYFLSVYEKVLREEGWWDGYLPYWDWTLDSAEPLKSPIWDPWSGFGGNGTSPHGCVQEGPLASFNASYEEFGYAPHCVTRIFDNDVVAGEMHGKKYSAEITRGIIKEAKSFNEFRERIENGPHKHLHLGIGGAMNWIESTNDPLFFVHHAQIDRLWWLWQQQNPGIRNHEFFGPVGYANSTISETGGELEDRILMLGLARDRSVHELMTTQSDVLCYKYDVDF